MRFSIRNDLLAVETLHQRTRGYYQSLKIVQNRTGNLTINSSKYFFPGVFFFFMCLCFSFAKL